MILSLTFLEVNKRHVLLTIYYVIQKTMSPRKSEEDAMIKFCKP